jgi:hypothetical protein
MKSRFMTLLVLSSVFAALTVLLHRPSTLLLAVGNGDVSFDIVILDAASGQPIAGASVRLQDPDSINEPLKEPYSIVRSSGPDGCARIKLKGLMVTSRDRVTEDGRFLTHLSRSVRYPSWECHVNAEGYQDLKVSYQDFRSRYTGGRRFHEESAPPPIVLRLERQVRPTIISRAVEGCPSRNYGDEDHGRQPSSAGPRVCYHEPAV